MSSTSSSQVATDAPVTEKVQEETNAEGEEKPELVPENLAIEDEESKNQTKAQKEWKKLQIVGEARMNSDGERNEAPVVDDWESECPLFMTKLPDDPADNPYLAALEAIANDEVDREYTAEELKARGNVCFQRGPQFYRQAVTYYTDAIRLKVEDKEKVSVYYSNRAAANLGLKNFRKAIEDSKEAWTLNPKNAKSYFRAARAATALKKQEEALKYIEMGLEIEPTNAELLKERNDVEKSLEARYQEDAVERKKKEERDALRNKMMTEKREFYEAVAARGVSVGKYLLASTQEDYLKSSKGAYINKQTKEMHWPVMFLYEEYMQMDFIADFAESHTFGQHLELMFPPGQFLPWDLERKYVLPKLEVYFIANQVDPVVVGTGRRQYSDLRRRKIRVKHSTELRKVLTHKEYVVTGYPIFYIVAEDSDFKEKFLKRSFEHDT